MQEMLEMTYQNEKFPAFLVMPAGTIHGGLVLIHEVWALDDHIKDVAERYAQAGYVVLAPDLLAETDIAAYADQLKLDLFNPKARNEAQPKLRQLMAPMQIAGFSEKTLGRLKVCFDKLYDVPEVSQKVGVTGFCFGGSYSYTLAVNEPRLKAAVPFYGHPPMDPDELKKIRCPILAFYGEKDENLMKDLEEVKRLMQAAGVDYTAKVYPDCGHAFFNDTNPYSYNEAAATDAWERTLAFLQKHLLGAST